MRITSIAILMSIFWLSSCKKRTLIDQLPAVTTNGNMTFGCIMNGNSVYTVHGNPINYATGWNVICQTGITAQFHEGALIINTFDCPANTYAFTLMIADTFLSPGTYKLGKLILDSSRNVKSNILAMGYRQDP